MKILKLHIAAFGGLKDKTMTFSDGFQVIYGENENGKTTVMNFIKMMFYGNARGSAQITKNPRKKYTPWDGSPMAGSIEFEHGGRTYRLEREFKSSNSTDKVLLTDLGLGTREAVSPDIGERFFGLSAAAFERSMFIAEPGGVEGDAGAEGEINAKLSNMVTTGDESVSYNTVHARLEKAQQGLMSKRKVGEYDKNEKAIAELEEELRRAEQIFSEYEKFKVAVEKQKELLAEKAKRAKQLKEKIDGEQDIRNAKKMREMLAAKEELDAYNRQYALSDGGAIDEMYVKKLDFCLRKAEECAGQADAKRKEAESLEETIRLALHPSEEVSPKKEEELVSEITKLEEQLAAIKQRADAAREENEALSSREEQVLASKKGIQPALILPAALCLVAAAVLFVTTNPLLAGVTAAAGVLLMIAGLLFRPKDTKAIREWEAQKLESKEKCAALASEQSETVQKVSETNVRLAAVRAALNSSAAVIERQKEQLALCKQELAEREAERKREEETLFELFARYRPVTDMSEIRETLSQLEKAADGQKELKNRLRYLASDLDNLSYEEAKEKLNALPDRDWEEADFEAWKREYETLAAEISDKKAVLSAAQARADAQLAGAKQPEILKKEIAERRRTAASQKAYFEAAQLADEILTDSFALLRKSYGSALEKRAGEIFAGLTGGRYDALQISKAFELFASRPDVFGAKESAYLSSGTEDQAYLSLRLALSELIFENAERMPVLLDDVLSRYDDGRMKTAVRYLSELSGQNQILFFTCHDAVKQAAEESGGETVSLGQ